MEDGWLTVSEYADKYRLSPKQVRRQIKKGLIEAKQPAPGCGYRIHDKVPHETPVRTQTPEEIVIRHEREQAVPSHFEDLRGIARQMKTQLWLPPPWRWDVAHLQFVFYVDGERLARGEGVTGYKLPANLVGSEESKGHFRCFEEGCVHWAIQKDSSILLKLSIEDEAIFGHLKEHSPESSAWALLTKWKQLGGDYIKFCSSLLARIEQDAEKAIGAQRKLFGWTIYHDTFCVKDTQCRCETCGTENVAGSRFCQGCNLPLGWLRPLAKEYERATNHPQLSPIHIHGWGNIEESVKIERFEGMTRGHRALIDKYRGCDLVETILKAEKEVRQVQVRLIDELTSLSEQRVFHGECPACPDY